MREPAAASDGLRILVDRLWPRGLTKDRAAVDYWSRDTAPSKELRQWYRHEVDKWPEFRRRYFAELEERAEAVAELRARIAAAPGAVTLVFDSREEVHNNASALRDYLSR